MHLVEKCKLRMEDMVMLSVGGRELMKYSAFLLGGGVELVYYISTSRGFRCE